MNTQVQIYPTKVSILSIPRGSAWLFTAGLLKCLYSYTRVDADFKKPDFGGSSSKSKRKSIDSLRNQDNFIRGNRDEESYADNSQDEDTFFHIAFTPSECTIIISTSKVPTYFKEPLETSAKLNLDVKLIEESFIALQVDCYGTDNSTRLLQLTEPLAQNGISLFFLSTHIADIVLIPERVESKVVAILQQKGFQFFNNLNGYLNIANTAGVGASSPSPPNLSPIFAPEELQSSPTFNFFQHTEISPRIKLFQTGARSSSTEKAIIATATHISSNHTPPYFAITRTSTNELSLLLPQSLQHRALLGYDASMLIGSASDLVFPIVVDLSMLPLDTKGVIVSLARRLIQGFETNQEKLLAESGIVNSERFEVNYLSMARSAVLLIPVEFYELVSCILNDSKNR